jgi:hypothetical protein
MPRRDKARLALYRRLGLNRLRLAHLGLLLLPAGVDGSPHRQEKDHRQTRYQPEQPACIPGLILGPLPFSLELPLPLGFPFLLTVAGQLL